MTTWPGMGAGRDPRRLCGAPDPFNPWNGLGDGNTRGYQYGRNHSTGGTQESEGFSLGGFVRDTLTGAVIGGLGSAGFYGAGRAVEVLRGSVGRSRGGSGSRYSPINPGPLNEDVANTFNGATYTERTLTEDTVMYRVSGGNAAEIGSYMSRTPQNGGLQSQLDLALNPAWGNKAENVTRVIIPKKQQFMRV